MITYRLLPADEWDRLLAIQDRIPGPIPQSPEYASAAVAEDEGGRIIGVLFLQIALHLEPLAIDPGHRGKVNFLRLAETLDQAVEASANGEPVEYFTFTPDKRIAKMCKMNGMRQKPVRVWSKRIGGEEE